MKFFRDYFLPCFAGGKFCQLANCILFTLKTEVSSYSLKQVLRQEDTEFSSSGHWKNDFIRLRIASMLQKHLEGHQNIIEKTTPCIQCFCANANKYDYVITQWL